jgi:hypothetical protein
MTYGPEATKRCFRAGSNDCRAKQAAADRQVICRWSFAVQTRKLCSGNDMPHSAWLLGDIGRLDNLELRSRPGLQSASIFRGRVFTIR